MLLNSPMSCDIHLQPPTSIMSRMRSPPPTSCASPTTILSSCRALQSLLQSTLPSSINTSQPLAPTRLDSPISFITAPKKPNKAHKITKSTPKKPSSQQQQRKRRRALSDDLGPSCDQENVFQPDFGFSKPSTPKRQRRAPPTLPLGLEPSDFEALTPAHTPFNLDPTTTFISPTQTPPFALPAHLQASRADTPVQYRQSQMTPDSSHGAEGAWTAEDDSALVSLILGKFRLKQSDWEECAEKLGKGGKGDSIGERWRMLVGEGEVGLRRGAGRVWRRPGLGDLEMSDAGGV